MLRRYKDVVLLSFILLIIFQIYIYTSYPAFKNDDSPETAAVSFTLGIGHPPGYPLFTIAAKIFTFLPLGSPAFRTNLFACFMAMLALLLFYFLIKQNMRLCFNGENRIINLLAALIPAFSFIFWNQAIEAKGGIYMLNLLFLSVLVYLSAGQLAGFRLTRAYLIAYIFGLSLTNHWPSMTVFLPIPAYLFYKDRKVITKKNFVLMLLFFLCGISAYLYMPIRAGNGEIFVFMARPDNIKNFLWTVFLSGNNAAVLPSMNIDMQQIKEIFATFLKNFLFLWPLILAGLYALWRSNKKVLFVYLSVFVVNLFVVIFSLRLSEQYYWAIGNFLMPSMLVSAICMAAGVYFISKFFAKKLSKNIFYTIIVAVLLYCAFIQFKADYSRYNFIAYDFGNNIVNTIEPGSFYMPEGDFYNMPFIYCGEMKNRVKNIKYVNLYSLQYEWGIDGFIRKYGYVNLSPAATAANVAGIIDRFAAADKIYFSAYAPALENMNNGFKQKVYGILYRICRKEGAYCPGNIRGIFVQGHI